MLWRGAEAEGILLPVAPWWPPGLGHTHTVTGQTSTTRRETEPVTCKHILYFVFICSLAVLISSRYKKRFPKHYISNELFCVNVYVLCVGSIATIPRQSPLVRVMVTLVTAPDLTSVIINPQTVQYSTVHVTCALLLLIVNWQAKVYYCNLCKLMHIMHKTMDHADQIYIINW